MLLTIKSDPILHVLAKNGVANTPAGSLILGQQPITSIYGVPSARASALCSSPVAKALRATPSSSAHASSPSTGPSHASSNPPGSSPDSLRLVANPEQLSSASPRSWSSDSEHPAEYQPAGPCSSQ